MDGDTQKELKLEGNRTITTGRLRAMRDCAHRLINQLTAISGYTQIALACGPESCIEAELAKIVKAVNRANKEVLSCLETVNEVEKGMPGP